MGLTASTTPVESDIDLLLYAVYRISAYVLMNVGEDAALVAFMFC